MHKLQCYVEGTGTRMATDKKVPEQSRQHGMISTVRCPPSACLSISSVRCWDMVCGLLKLLTIRSAAHHHQASEHIFKSPFHPSFLDTNMSKSLGCSLLSTPSLVVSFLFADISLTSSVANCSAPCLANLAIISNHTQAWICQQETCQQGQKFPCSILFMKMQKRVFCLFFFWLGKIPSATKQHFLIVDPKYESPGLCMFALAHSHGFADKFQCPYLVTVDNYATQTWSAVETNIYVQVYTTEWTSA